MVLEPAPLSPDLGNDYLPAVLSQNNVELVEEALQEILTENPSVVYDEDPTERPKGWFNDEDILKRKFRR